jgi:hypothetical protein
MGKRTTVRRAQTADEPACPEQPEPGTLSHKAGKAGKVYYFPLGNDKVPLNRELESAKTFDGCDVKEMCETKMLLTWNNMQRWGTDHQKDTFINLRENLINLLQDEVGKLNPGVVWYRTGSTSPVSDVDITLIPPIHDSRPLPDVLARANACYKTMFALPMDVMFDMNIYATPFYYTCVRKFKDCVKFVDVEPDLDLLDEDSCESSSPVPSPRPRASDDGAGSFVLDSPHSLNRVPSLLLSQPSVRLQLLRLPTLRSSSLSPKSRILRRSLSGLSATPNTLKYLDVDSVFIKEFQYPVALQVLEQKSKRFIHQIQTLTTLVAECQKRPIIHLTLGPNNPPAPDPERQYADLIKSYQSCLTGCRGDHSNADDVKNNTKRAVDFLTRSTEFLREAYRTQGAVLHVTCPLRFREGCIESMKKTPAYFVCSALENLAYALEKQQEGYPLKSAKYVERACEALVLWAGAPSTATNTLLKDRQDLATLQTTAGKINEIRKRADQSAIDAALKNASDPKYADVWPEAIASGCLYALDWEPRPPAKGGGKRRALPGKPKAKRSSSSSKPKASRHTADTARGPTTAERISEWDTSP